ncbi:ATP-binding protein [Kitasatospora kifunensis]|uniref:HAMP domain-containing protein n=1 Tax=Kitasatospora kifunensis TaxID=58351 RepID=A0A7W7W035_KITKI|nr:ATP-binding protein [Kitasatospora kifunensis]MBB4928260.1 HAMP domain-containing protein [Kitasatospora kifunensis]
MRSVATSWGITSDPLDRLVSIASELIANALRHTPPGTVLTELSLTPTGELLRFAVTDQMGRAPIPTPQDRFGDDTAEAGRGLLIVSLLADRWATTPAAITGKTVWAELDLPIPLDVPALQRQHRRLAALADLVAAGHPHPLIRLHSRQQGPNPARPDTHHPTDNPENPMPTSTIPFTKGNGTENDFVLLGDGGD